jgi:WD40 repeat protein
METGLKIMDTPEIIARSNPYVGTRPFMKGETLYGRERETSELLDLLIAERIVMLYSPSGAGKSSLLNAAILPKMETNGFEVLPVMRFNHEPDAQLEQQPGFNRYIFSLLICLEEDIPAEKRFSEAELAGLSLKDYLARRRERSAQLDPHYDATLARLLVIDQGEEVITIVPTDREKKQEFFNQLGETLRDRSLWLLFALREDYIARMDSYIKPIPTGFSTRYRLRLLQPDEAISAIQKPAAEQNVVFTDEAALKMTNDLRTMQVQQQDGTSLQEPGLYVEPVQLQVVCRRLWSALDPADNKIGLDNLEAIGDVNTALADFYAEQVAMVARKVGVRERFIRMWFDRKLITTQGIRGQVLLAPTRSDGLENTAIWELEKTYLVRSEKRGGSTWFELSHDRLISPIVKDNSTWFEKNLSALQRQADVWNQESRPLSMLITGPDFLEMQTWVQANQSEMSDMETDFYKASLNAYQAELREKRNNLIIRWLGIAAAIIAVIAIGLFFQARDAEHRAVARQLAAAALNNLAVDPELSVMLALSSQKLTGDLSRENIEALHLALPVIRVEKALEGHKDKVYAVDFSPDSKSVASGGKDGLVLVWDVVSGKLLQNLAVVPNPGTGFGVTNVVYSPDGKILAASTQSGTVVLFDTGTWQVARTIAANKMTVWGLAISPDGSLLATGSEDHTIKLWDLASGALLNTFGVENCEPSACGRGHTDTVNSLAFSPNGKWLASGGEDASIRVWDLATKQFAFKLGGPNAHTAAVNRVVFSPDSQQLASASTDRLIKIWDLATQDLVMNISGHADWVYGLAYTPDGANLVSSSSDRTIRVWDTAYGRLQKTLTGHGDQVFDVSVSADGSTIASASQDKSVRIWDITTSGSREILTLDNKDRVNTLAYSPDGSRLAYSGRSPDIKIWDVHTKTLLNSLVGHHRLVDGLAWGPDGSWLVSVSADAQAIVWDVASATQKLVFTQHKAEIRAVALSKDGSFVASGDTSGLIYVWNAQTGELLHTLLKTELGAVMSLDISPDQKRLAAGYEQGKVVIWDLANPRAVNTLSGHTDFVQGVRFNAQGTILASVSDDGYLILWNLRVTPPAVLSKTPAHRGTIYAVAFSSDGQYVITGGADRLVNVRDITDPKDPRLVYTLYGFTDSVLSLAVNARNGHIAAGGSDNSVRIFTLDTNELITQARERLTRKMSEAECQNNLDTSCEDFANTNILDEITIFLARRLR